MQRESQRKENYPDNIEAWFSVSLHSCHRCLENLPTHALTWTGLAHQHGRVSDKKNVRGSKKLSYSRCRKNGNRSFWQRESFANSKFVKSQWENFENWLNVDSLNIYKGTKKVFTPSLLKLNAFSIAPSSLSSAFLAALRAANLVYQPLTKLISILFFFFRIKLEKRSKLAVSTTSRSQTNPRLSANWIRFSSATLYSALYSLL